MTTELSAQRSASPQSRTVLVVEDDVLLRLDIAEELRLAGCHVLEVASAEGALELFASGYRADAVFSDFHLSGAATGWDLRRSIARTNPDVEFILTSGRTPPAEVHHDTVRFIRKPYRPEQVLKAIRRALAGKDSDDRRR